MRFFISVEVAARVGVDGALCRLALRIMEARTMARNGARCKS
jgi:hypothetical protein